MGHYPHEGSCLFHVHPQDKSNQVDLSICNYHRDFPQPPPRGDLSKGNSRSPLGRVLRLGIPAESSYFPPPQCAIEWIKIVAYHLPLSRINKPIFRIWIRTIVRVRLHIFFGICFWTGLLLLQPHLSTACGYVFNPCPARGFVHNNGVEKNRSRKTVPIQKHISKYSFPFFLCGKIANRPASNSLPRPVFSLFLIDHLMLAFDWAFQLWEVILGFIVHRTWLRGAHEWIEHETRSRMDHS